MKPLVCIAGKNKIAIEGLKIASQIVGQKNVVALPNASDDGISRWQPSLVKHARELDIRVVTIEEIAPICNLIFISLEYDRIIKPSNFSSKKLFNLHFSYLPAYKGCYTSAWPILNGESNSGVTLHEIDFGIDTGDIIHQECFPLEENETARTLYNKYIEKGINLLNKVMDKIILGQYSLTRQSPEKSTYYSRKSIDYSLVSIDVQKTANMISRQIRAFNFPEYQLPSYCGIKIGECSITNNKSTHRPGTLVRLDEKRFILSSIDYDLVLEKSFYYEFCDAAIRGDTIALESLIRKDKKLLNETTFLGKTALHHFLDINDISSIARFLELGANPLRENSDGLNALQYAESLGRYSIAKLISSYL
jgi:methionyl-tRNA formyltransferase